MIDIVSRQAWGARAPKRVHRPEPAQFRDLWLHHSAGSGADEKAVRGIQDFHMDSRGWSDIAYSFLIDNDAPDVDIFEGRGYGVAGGHTAGHNTTSHAVCIIGDYSTKAPHDDTLNAIVDLVVAGHDIGWFPAGFTGGHRDASGANTSCPGGALHRLIPELNAEIVARVNMEDEMSPEDRELLDWLKGQREAAYNPSFDGAMKDALGLGMYSKYTENDDLMTASKMAEFLLKRWNLDAKLILAEESDDIAAIRQEVQGIYNKLEDLLIAGDIDIDEVAQEVAKLLTIRVL